MGPSDFFKVNPKLIYGRMTGWGQFGLHASDPGHDINYIALTGALSSIGIKNSPPIPPLNLVGDFGGGGMLLAMGICAALVEVAKSGKGQVIDSAMTDGSALLMSMMYGFYSAGIWTDHRESNLLDGAAHFYGCYECKDGKYVSVGSIEPQFYEELVKRLELDREKFKDQMDRSRWSELKKIMEKKFMERTRDEWCKVMEGGDICFAPVLSLEESINYKHNKERETFIDIDGVIQPAPAPRFSNTPGKIQHSPVEKGKHTREIIKSIGKENLIEELLKSKIIAEG